MWAVRVFKLEPERRQVPELTGCFVGEEDVDGSTIYRCAEKTVILWRHAQRQVWLLGNDMTTPRSQVDCAATEVAGLHKWSGTMGSMGLVEFLVEAMTLETPEERSLRRQKAEEGHLEVAVHSQYSNLSGVYSRSLDRGPYGNMEDPVYVRRPSANGTFVEIGDEAPPPEDTLYLVFDAGLCRWAIMDGRQACYAEVADRAAHPSEIQAEWLDEAVAEVVGLAPVDKLEVECCPLGLDIEVVDKKLRMAMKKVSGNFQRVEDWDEYPAYKCEASRIFIFHNRAEGAWLWSTALGEECSFVMVKSDEVNLEKLHGWTGSKDGKD